MSKQLQLRGGTTAEHSTFTGAVREVTVDTDKDTLVVHDGSTAGGFPLLRNTVEDATPQLGGNLDLNGNNITGTGDIDITGTLDVSGAATFGDSLTVTGDLTVNGTTTTISAENLAIEDSMVYLNQGSTVTNPDLGWAGNYNDGTYAHLGVFADATDSNKFKFYKGYTPEPGSTIDTTHASYTPATVVAGTFEGDLTGDVTGNVSGNVTGNITGAVTGNASTATALQTSRTISLTGDVVGSASFDGTANASISATIQPNSVALGTDTTGAYVADVVQGSGITLTETASGAENNTVTVAHADTSSQASVNNSGNTFIQDITLDTYGHITGLTSSTAVINDGTLTMGTSGTGISGSATFTANDSDNVTFTVSSNATNANTASTIVARDGSGNFSAGTITAALSGNATTSSSCTGNAATATRLQTARTINGVSFNGTGNITVEPYISDDDTGDTNCPITFTATSIAGYKRLYEDSSLYMDNSSNYIYGAQFIATSDRNLKDNIVNVTDAVSKVQKLNGVTFNWKETGQAEAGVIAQDVLEVLPEAVQEHQNGHLSVNYGSLHALLIEAIKEQQVQINELKAKLGE